MTSSHWEENPTDQGRGGSPAGQTIQTSDDPSRRPSALWSNNWHEKRSLKGGKAARKTNGLCRLHSSEQNNGWCWQQCSACNKNLCNVSKRCKTKKLLQGKVMPTRDLPQLFKFIGDTKIKHLKMIAQWGYHLYQHSQGATGRLKLSFFPISIFHTIGRSLFK